MNDKQNEEQEEEKRSSHDERRLLGHRERKEVNFDEERFWQLNEQIQRIFRRQT